jgi:3-deoxy-D-manno-octulosonic-acid transferase
METEIWPNLFFECQSHQIPVIIANGRLSEKSLRGYGPIRPLARSALASTRYIAAQSMTDAARLQDLGADPDASASSATSSTTCPCRRNCTTRPWMRAAWGAQRPVWVAASTHDGEEMPVLKAHAEVLRRFPDALLLLAPRHPERFKPVVLACRSLGFAARTRGEDGSATQDTQVFRRRPAR